MRILGIDPGSRLTGYGIIDVQGKKLQHVTSGTIRLNPGQKTVPLCERLLLLSQSLQDLAEEYQPKVLSLEKVFFAKNASSALQLGQARGVVLLSGARHGMLVHEYNPTEVKRSVVGHGRAEKEAVSKMIQLLLGVQKLETLDESDALALAVCHAQHFQTSRRMGKNAEIFQKKRAKRSSLAETLGVKIK